MLLFFSCHLRILMSHRTCTSYAKLSRKKRMHFRATGFLGPSVMCTPSRALCVCLNGSWCSGRSWSHGAVLFFWASPGMENCETTACSRMLLRLQICENILWAAMQCSFSKLNVVLVWSMWPLDRSTTIPGSDPRRMKDSVLCNWLPLSFSDVYTLSCIVRVVERFGVFSQVLRSTVQFFLVHRWSLDSPERPQVCVIKAIFLEPSSREHCVKCSSDSGLAQNMGSRDGSMVRTRGRRVSSKQPPVSVGNSPEQTAEAKAVCQQISDNLQASVRAWNQRGKEQYKVEQLRAPLQRVLLAWTRRMVENLGQARAGTESSGLLSRCDRITLSSCCATKTLFHSVRVLKAWAPTEWESGTLEEAGVDLTVGQLSKHAKDRLESP